MTPISTSTGTAFGPEVILSDLLGFDPDLRSERYWGERSVFYNPGDAAPLGTIFASVKDHDGPNDSSSRLSRDGIYRLAFCLPAEHYTTRFGEIPARPPKGGVVGLDRYDPARLHELTPHPVYAWMRWVQILSPSPEQYQELRPLLDASLEQVRLKWEKKRSRR